MPNTRRTRVIAAALIILALAILSLLLTLRQRNSGSELLTKELSSQVKPSAGQVSGSAGGAPNPPADSVRPQPVKKRSSDQPLFVIEGRVLSDEGEGLTGAHLEVFIESSSENLGAPVRVVAAEKGGAYRLELDFAEHKVIKVRAEMPGFLDSEESVRMDDEGGMTMDFVLSRFASTVSGRALDSEGNGVAGARVQLSVPRRGRAEGGSAGFIAFGRSETTNSSTDGSFTFADLSPGPIGFEIDAKDYFSSQTSLQLKPGKNTIEIRLKRTAKLEVHVRNRAGEPVPNANVSSLSMDMFAQAKTTADGVALIRIPNDAGDQEFGLGVKATGYLHKVVKRRPGASRIEVVLLNAPQLVGRVTTEQGEPLEGCHVFTLARIAALDERHSRFSAGGNGLTDQDGRFSIEAVERGRLHVRCRDFPGLAKAVSAEDAGRELSIVLKNQDSALLGLVLDPSGRPVTDFIISLQEAGAGNPIAGSQLEGFSLQRSFHDSQGRFSFPAISAGSWVISAWSADASMVSNDSRITLARGQATEGVVVRVRLEK